MKFAYKLSLAVAIPVWLFGILVVIAGTPASGWSLAQPTPSASGSPSGSQTTTTTMTTTRTIFDPPPAISRIHYPNHRESYSRLRVVKGSVRPTAPVRIALLKRTKSGDCWWRHPHRWVRSACNELYRHLKFSAAGTRPWKWHPPRLRPSVGRIRFYTVFSFADYNGSPFQEDFDPGRNRIWFEIR